MKKIVIIILSVVIVASIALIINFGTKSNSEKETANSNSNNIESKEIKQKEGYEIIISKKDITIEKGSNTSFEITFTNPDESSIREYITCKDQNDIILVKYSMLENKKITVEVEALKVGVTEIVVCDYNYPDMKEIIKVNVVETKNTESGVTAEMAYEGVNNYCHSTYDWSIAENNNSIMYVAMGDETEAEYKVIFRNYTGALVYFYVNKLSGTTRMTEYVPTLEIESEAGTIDLYDYLNKND